MAKKDSKQCKKCDKLKTECICPKKGKGGYYGFGREMDDSSMDSGHGIEDGGGDGGGMSEAIRMPKAPSDADKSMKDTSREKREKTLSNFKAAVDDAKKRQKYKNENDDLAVTRMKKGVRFYDKTGSGYMKGGKKTYD